MNEDAPMVVSATLLMKLDPMLALLLY